jgi:hypothetical protein
MSEYNELCRFMNSKLPTCIQEIRCDNCLYKGKFQLVGSIPIELTNLKPTMYDRNHRSSKVWNTEKEVIDALLAIGIKEFQLADTSWYKGD